MNKVFFCCNFTSFLKIQRKPPCYNNNLFFYCFTNRCHNCYSTPISWEVIDELDDILWLNSIKIKNIFFGYIDNTVLTVYLLRYSVFRTTKWIWLSYSVATVTIAARTFKFYTPDSQPSISCRCQAGGGVQLYHGVRGPYLRVGGRRSLPLPAWPHIILH